MQNCREEKYFKFRDLLCSARESELSNLNRSKVDEIRKLRKKTISYEYTCPVSNNAKKKQDTQFYYSHEERHNRSQERSISTMQNVTTIRPAGFHSPEPYKKTLRIYMRLFSRLLKTDKCSAIYCSSLPLTREMKNDVLAHTTTTTTTTWVTREIHLVSSRG